MKLIKILILVVGVISSCVFYYMRTSVQNHRLEYEKILAEVPEEMNIERLRSEKEAVTSDVNGMLKILGFTDVKKINAADKRIYYAEKVSGLEKRLRKKAEELKVVPPDIRLPKNLPSEEKAESFIRQLETIERIVDKGLESGVNFSEIRVLEELNAIKKDEKQKEKIFDKVKIQISFTSSQDNLGKYLLNINETVPLINIEKFKVVKNDGNTQATLQLSKYVFSESLDEQLSIDSDVVKSFDEYTKISNTERRRFMSTDFLMGKREIEISSSDERAIVKIKEEKTTIVFKGIAVLRGKKVALIEDVLLDEIFFMTTGELINGYKMISFDEGKAIFKSINNNEEKIFKRETD